MSTPPQFEWQTAEQDGEWVQLCNEPVAPARAGSRWVYWSTAILVVLLAAAGSWRYTTHVRAHPGATELVAAVHHDLQGAALTATPSGNQVWEITDPAGDQRQLMEQTHQLAVAAPISFSVHSPGEEPDPDQTIELRTLDIQNDLAVVNVKTQTHRETRFYRRTADGWQAAEPDPARWGPAQRLETDSFVFEYQAQDGATVAAVAPQLEAMYKTMRSNFGLENPSPPVKIVVQVSLMQRPSNNRLIVSVDPRHSRSASTLPSPQYRIKVASPARYRAPVALSDADLLAQSLALPLVTYVVSEVSRDERAEWYMEEESNLFQALILWQLWDLQLPLAAWRAPVVQWRFHTLPRHDLSQAPTLPSGYDDLCAMHQLWLFSPKEIGIPLTCGTTDRSPSYGSEMHRTLTGQLDESALVVGHLETSYWIDWSSDAVALATLFEFVVNEYGRERLPLFLQGVANYTRVDTLIPQVFGISPAEFEAEWQAYLAALDE